MSDAPESSHSKEVPAQALPKRWQFIDASSNRLNNQTTVRRHVMQEYHMRQKRHRTAPSNEDSEVVEELSQDSTPKIRRRSKKSKISDKNPSDEDRKEHDVIKSAQNIISLAMKSTRDLHQKSSEKSISDEDKKERDVTDPSQNIISLVRRSTRDSQQKTRRQPKKNELPAPVRPSPARWQFIDSSSNSRSNLAKVKSHVMLEYNRQKREDSSNKDGEASCPLGNRSGWFSNSNGPHTQCLLAHLEQRFHIQAHSTQHSHLFWTDSSQNAVRGHVLRIICGCVSTRTAAVSHVRGRIVRGKLGVWAQSETRLAGGVRLSKIRGGSSSRVFRSLLTALHVDFVPKKNKHFPMRILHSRYIVRSANRRPDWMKPA